VTRKRPDRYVLRSATSVISFWVGAAVMLVVVGIPLVQADWSLVRILLAPSLLLVWLFWIVLYRPSVRYDSALAIVVNIGRTHVLPWGHVVHLRQGLGLMFELDTGKTVQAVGVPAPRRRGIIGSVIDRRTRPTQEFHQDVDILDGVRQSATSSSVPVASTWDIIPLAIGGVLLVAVIIEFAVGF
jgi:hypothetical protein